MNRLNLRSHFPNLINQSFWFVHRPNLITLGYQKACRDFYSWEFEISGPKWRQISIFNWMIRIADIIKTWIANTSQIIEIWKLLRPGIVEHRNLWRVITEKFNKIFKSKSYFFVTCYREADNMDVTKENTYLEMKTVKELNHQRLLVRMVMYLLIGML